MIEFSTAAGKTIEVSEEAIKQAKKKLICEDEGPETFEDGSKPSPTFNVLGFSTAAGKKIEVSEEAIKQAKKKLICENEGTETFEDGSKPSPTFNVLGFSTAAGKKIEVSDEAIKQAKKRLICEDEGTETFEDSYKTSGTFNVLGFSTAAGKKIEVSEEAIKQAKKRLICEDEGPETFEDSSKTAPTFNVLGFSTAAGKRIEVSEEAIKQAKKKLICEDEGTETFEDGSKPSPTFNVLGFSTAAGKKIEVSDEAIKQAKKRLICEDEGTETFEDSSKTAPTFNVLGFSTAAGKKIEVSDEAIKQAKKKLICEDESPETFEDGSKLSPTFNVLGFSTAAGKKIEVSDEAIKQAKKKLICEDGGEEDLESRPSGSTTSSSASSSLETSPESELSVAEESNAPWKAEFEESIRLLMEDENNDDDASQWTSDSFSECTPPQPSLSCSYWFEDGQTRVMPKISLAVIRIYNILYRVYRGERMDVYNQHGFERAMQQIDIEKEELRQKLFPEMSKRIRKEKILKLPGDVNFIGQKRNTTLKTMNEEDLLKYLLWHQEEGSDVVVNLSFDKEMKINDMRLRFEEDVISTINKELTDAIEKQMPKCRTVPFVKLLVVDADSYLNNTPNCRYGYLSIMNPIQEILGGLREGGIYEFSNISGNSANYNINSVTLSAQKDTVITPINDCSPVSCDMSRKLYTVGEVIAESFKPMFGEFDTVGIITRVWSEGSIDYMTLTDGDSHELKIKFWISMKELGLVGYQMGRSILCSNLQWRLFSQEQNTAHVQQTSVFMVKPNPYEIIKNYPNTSMTSQIKNCFNIRDDIENSPGESICDSKTPMSSETAVPYSSSSSIKRLGAPRFRSGLKRKSETLERATEDDEPSDATPVSKKGRLSRKFIPPRRV